MIGTPPEDISTGLKMDETYSLAHQYRHVEHDSGARDELERRLRGALAGDDQSMKDHLLFIALVLVWFVTLPITLPIAAIGMVSELVYCRSKRYREFFNGKPDGQDDDAPVVDGGRHG